MKWLARHILLLAALAPALFWAAPATAQQVCVPREQAVAWLEEQFSEKPLGRGLTSDGRAMFELFVSEEGSWTILVSQPKGPSCVVAAGQHWRQVPDPSRDQVAVGPSAGGF